MFFTCLNYIFIIGDKMNNDYLIEIFNSDNYVEKILELSFEQRLNIACSSDNIINYIFTKILQKVLLFLIKKNQ